MFFHYDSMSLLGFGFVVGFCIVLFSFLFSKFSGKEVLLVRKSFLIVGAILITIFISPTGAISRFWLLISLLFTALIINYLIDTVYTLEIIPIKIEESKIRKLYQIIYIIAILIGIIIVATGSITAAIITFDITKKIIIFSLGIWLALKILWKKNQSR